MPFIAIILAVLLVDQASKYLLRHSMGLGESIPVIDGIFHITYIENPGAAFGLFANKTIFFVLLTFVITGILIYLYVQLEQKNSLTAIALALVIGGAIGNLVDRVIKGTVTDMFDFRIWPVFNVADMALVIGLCYIAYQLIFHGEDISWKKKS